MKKQKFKTQLENFLTMKKTKFQIQLESLIKTAPMEEIISFFETEKKKNYKEKFLQLNVIKMKDWFLKNKNFRFEILGITKWNHLDFSLNMYEVALDNNRIDVIQFLFNNNLIEEKALSLYFNRIANSNITTLENIMSIKFFTDKINERLLHQMINECVARDNTEHFEVLLNYDKPYVEKIVNNLTIEAAKANSNKILKRLLNGTYSTEAKINYALEGQSNYDGSPTYETVFTIACKNKNKELIKYLLTSEELKEKTNLVENFWWVQNESQSEEIVEFLILDMNIEYSDEIKKIINTLGEYQEHQKNKLTNLFEKRKLKNELEDNLPQKTTASKVKKL